METTKKIGVLMIIIAVVVAIFGVWLKTYNDKIAQVQVKETGSCYLPDGTCLHTTSDSMMYFAFGIAVFLAALGAYLFQRKKEPKKIIIKKVGKRVAEEPTSDAIKTLNPEMKSVYEIITQSNGAILQGELVARSGMDKVKVSRTLDKLEMRGLIERRRHGMSNLIVLKKR